MLEVMSARLRATGIGLALAGAAVATLQSLRIGRALNQLEQLREDPQFSDIVSVRVVGAGGATILTLPAGAPLCLPAAGSTVGCSDADGHYVVAAHGVDVALCGRSVYAMSVLPEFAPVALGDHATIDVAVRVAVHKRDIGCLMATAACLDDIGNALAMFTAGLEHEFSVEFVLGNRRLRWTGDAIDADTVSALSETFLRPTETDSACAVPSVFMSASVFSREGHEARKRLSIETR